jgi:hypothetical protein
MRGTCGNKEQESLAMLAMALIIIPGEQRKHLRPVTRRAVGSERVYDLIMHPDDCKHRTGNGSFRDRDCDSGH